MSLFAYAARFLETRPYSQQHDPLRLGAREAICPALWPSRRVSLAPAVRRAQQWARRPGHRLPCGADRRTSSWSSDRDAVSPVLLLGMGTPLLRPGYGRSYRGEILNAASPLRR